jgi:hypothetical protein
VGCGYVKETWDGDVGDSGISVWEETENGYQLIYSRRTLGADGGPACNTRVSGVLPACDDWSEECDSAEFSYGGSSGAAGSANE